MTVIMTACVNFGMFFMRRFMVWVVMIVVMIMMMANLARLVVVRVLVVMRMSGLSDP